MYIISYSSVALFIFGTYMILMDRLKLPTIQSSKIAMKFYNQGKKESRIELFLDDVASQLSKFIIMDDYKRTKLKTKLETVNIYKTPEKYTAEIYVKSFFPLIFSIPLSFFVKISLPITAVFSVHSYFKNVNQLDLHLKKTREKIEYELPRFTRDIAEYLKSSRDILEMLKRYSRTAGEVLKKELEITISDMESGNYETALSRFESRIQSSMLSEVIRGLQGVLRGDSSHEHFQRLANSFKELELQRLKAEAHKRPTKIKKYSFLLLACMLGTYAVVLGVSIFKSMGGIF